MNTKELIKWIKQIIKFSKKFIYQVRSNNLLIYELKEILKPIQFFGSSNTIFFKIYDIMLNDGFVCSFYINKTHFIFNYTDIDQCIQSMKILRSTFINIYIYYQEFYKHQIRSPIDFATSINYLQNSYKAILDLLENFKQTTEPNIQNLYTDLVNIICNYKSLPKSLFKIGSKSVKLYYYKTNDLYEKVKFGKLNLITINPTCSILDCISSDCDTCSENYSDSCSDSNSDTQTVNTTISDQIIGPNPHIIVKTFRHPKKIINSSLIYPPQTFTQFKKNKFPQEFYCKFIFKIGSHEIKINENLIDNYEFLSKLNIILNNLDNCVSTIMEYRSFIENYENKQIFEIYDKKSIFDMNKCLFLREIYEKYIEFFLILKVDLENLSLFSQIDSSSNNLIVSSSYQNIINNLYSRLNDLNINLYSRLAIRSNSKNINVYYTDSNRCTIFFGTLNNLIMNSQNGVLGDIQQLQIIFSTITLIFNSNRTFGPNFYVELKKMIQDIEILETLVELNLKSLCDLILLLSQV